MTDAARTLSETGASGLTQYDDHPAALYAVDDHGLLAYYNAACVALSGRTPQVGVDRWCVCYILRCNEGHLLDPATGSMATSIRDGRPSRGAEAIFERPDGQSTHVRAFPTPALDEAGQSLGGVNLLIPTDGIVHHQLLDTARRWRTLAKWIGDPAVEEALLVMAAVCEEQAEVLRPA